MREGGVAGKQTQTSNTEVSVSVDTKGADGLRGSILTLGLSEGLASIAGVVVSEDTGDNDAVARGGNVEKHNVNTEGSVEGVPGHTTWAHQRSRR